MASVARTGNPCMCFGPSSIPVPAPRFRMLTSSFATSVGEDTASRRSDRLKHRSREIVRSQLRGVDSLGDERFLELKNLSSGLVRYAVSDNSKFGGDGSSGISTVVAEATDTICQKLKHVVVTVLLASSFQLACCECVLALDLNSNSLHKESTQAEITTRGFSSDKHIGASLSLDLKAPTVVSLLPNNSGTDSASQVLSDNVDTSTSSNPSAEIVRTTEVSNPECSTSSTVSVVADVTQDFEPVTNESVVEEAWEVVNENFLDARRHSWSADDWLRKKEEVLKRPLRSRMAAYGAIRGMLASLNDPYTRFLTPDQFLQLSKYDVTGVGLNIGEVEENGTTSLRVLGIVLGSPAQMMGVRQGDELVSVNGTSVRGMTAFEAASLIQGPKGTPVSIQIRHGPCEEAQNLTVAREQDVRTPVFYRLERGQNSRQLAGYIRLKEFNALAKRDLVTAMKRLQDAGATSFLLDLQDNPGGLVQAGIEIARLFLDGGETVIQTVGRDASNYKNIMATGVPFSKAPLMVLVNDHTASASEIVAAALHDNCRAVLVGNRTFGKGLIQSVYELSDGSGIILTVGKYVTPGHVDIDGNGIEPDFRNPPGLSEAMDKLSSCELKIKSKSALSNSS